MASVNDSSKHLRLSELTTALEQFFEQKFGSRLVWVRAEVANHQSYPNKGWHFFDLIEKDPNGNNMVAKMQAVSWRKSSESIQKFEGETGQKFANGLEVLVYVQVTFHAQYGLKLTLHDIDPSFTLGQMELKRRETLAKLLKEYPQFIRQVDGEIVTFNQDRLLPKVIKRIALITSSGAAGFEDFLHTLTGNALAYTFQLDFYFARVQGIDSWPTITNRVREIAKKHEHYDLAVIVRGGGAQTDLMLFDEFHLNLEIARCPVPVWTGIGHHRDSSISDLFCHTRLKTPTKVAEAIVEHNRSFEEQVMRLREMLINEAQQQLADHKSFLHHTSSVVTTRVPRMLNSWMEEQYQLHRKLASGTMRVLNKNRQELRGQEHKVVSRVQAMLFGENRALADLKAGLLPKTQRYLKLQKEYLGHIATMVRVSSPEKLLKRGYAIIRKEGKVMAGSAEIKVGDELSVEQYEAILSVAVQKRSSKALSSGDSPKEE